MARRSAAQIAAQKKAAKASAAKRSKAASKSTPMVSRDAPGLGNKPAGEAPKQKSMLEQMREKAAAAPKTHNDSLKTNSQKLDSVAAIYGRNSPQFRQAKRNLYGTRKKY